MGEARPVGVNINADPDNDWLCACGNTSHLDGFYACNAEGVNMEPDIGSTWAGHYLCETCGAIVFHDYEKDTAIITGYKKERVSP
jgi:hypothetical protein